jgi:hypothetical protein
MMLQHPSFSNMYGTRQVVQSSTYMPSGRDIFFFLV